MREDEFNLNEVVWAKLSGYPWWPAIILSNPDVSKYEVLYFGDFTRSFLHQDFIRKFNKHSLAP